MNTLWSIETERLASGASPEQLRQRMLEGGEESDQTSDYDFLLALYHMNEVDRMEALRQLPDAECERMVELIPLWHAIREMSRDEIVQLLASMDDD